MKYKSTLARGLSHAWPWTKPIGSSPTASRLLRYSLLCMLVLLGSGSMWADDATLAVDFEEETTSYTDWTFTNFATKQTNSGVAAHGGSYFGSTGGKSSGSLVTKEKLAKPKNIKFYISKTSTNSTASSWIIKVSTDGEEWTNVKTQSASADITKGTWTEVTQDLTSYTNVYVGIFYDGTTAIRTIDDVTLTYENVNDTRTATTIALADGYATTGVEGKTVALPTATVMAGENTVTGATVTWASSDENIATISGNTISLLSAGTATITATYAGDDSYKSSKATYDLTVTELSVDGLASMAIIFKDSGSSSDSGTKITSIDDIISEGNNYVSSIPTADNVYNGRTDRGLKLGASSKSATLTLTLAKAVKPIKITFDAMQYSATETSITVNGKTTTNLGSELATYSVIYDGETEVSSIEISTPSKRAYITNVKIYYEPEATPAPLYILGDMNSWDRTNPTKMTWDATKNAYTYELNNDATVSFCFADGTQTADEATADNEWSTFNSTYRWAPGEGDMEFPQRLVGFSITLLKVNGTIKLPAGTWTISIAPHDTPGEMGMTITGEATPVEEHTYIVAGSKAEIFGTSWDGTYEANKMTKQTDGTYQKTYTVDQAYEDVQLKVVKDGSDWIGDDNGYNVSFNLTGAGNFTVTINPETNVVSVTGDIVSFASTLDYESVYAVGNGEDAWLNGAAWDPAYQDNQMTEVSDGVWEISFENVPAGYARNIKFTIDGAWTHNFGGTFSEFGVATDAVYNGDNIEFDTENDLQNIKVQLDLSNFDFTTKEGAKFTITSEAVEEPKPFVFRDIKLDLTVQGFLTDDEYNNKSAVTAKLLVDEEGNISRNDDATEPNVNVTGNTRKDNHGWDNFKMTVPVTGKVKITIGGCEYNSSSKVLTVTPEGGEAFTIAAPAACWHSAKTKNIKSGYFDAGEQTVTLTITGPQYTPYVAIEAVDEIPSIYTVTYAKESDVEGTIPAEVEVTIGEAITLPKNYTLYKEGYTQTGWTDGATTYELGGSFTPEDDVTLTAVFTENTVSLADRTEAVTITFPLNGNKTNGLPLYNINNSGIIVTQATVGNATIDVKASITSGTLATNESGYHQVKNNFKATIPSCKGATVVINTYDDPTSLLTFGGSTGFKVSGSNHAWTATYTATADATSLDIAQSGSTYWNKLEITLPKVESEQPQPTEDVELFKWTYDAETTALDSEIAGTNGKITLKNSGTDAFTAEDATYTNKIADDMAPSKGLKLGKNTQYLTLSLTEGEFQAGDQITVCGYNEIMFCTSADRTATIGDVATGSNKNDYNVGTFTIPEDFTAQSTLYIFRKNGAGTGIAAIQAIRPGYDPNAVATPEISPATGTYTTDQEVAITCATEGATIYYATDGNNPTTESTVYTEPFTITETTTIKAFAIKNGYVSEIAESVITIKKDLQPGESDLEWDYTEAAPTENPDPDAKGNYLYYGAKSTAPTGVKLNSTGYAFFAKNPVEGKLTLTFGLKSGTGAYAVNVYACDNKGVKGDLLGEVSVSESPGTGSIVIPATVTGIRIERKTGSEGVLSKIVFKEIIPRTFKDFEITNEQLKGTIADMNLPQGVTLTGTQPEAGNNSHGYINASISVPTDGGAVKFTIGGCQYANKSFTVTNSDNETIATLSNKTTNCYHQDASVVTYFYTGEATTLTFSTIPYLPYFKAEAVEVEEVTVTFKDQNGNELGKKTVFEGEAIGEVPFTEADLTIPEGEKFRGWVYASGVKVQATDIVDGNKTISASVTAIEKNPEVSSIQVYDLTKATFYPEDHENFDVTDGKYYNNHGFDFAAGGSFSVKVAGKAQINLSLCEYGNGTTITVTNGNETIAENVPAKAESGKDGATTSVNYDGEATTLTFTFAAQTYLHSVRVYNVTDFLEKDEASGYIIVPAGDGAGLVQALNIAASEANSKIFLPNGTYDLGESTLTPISGNNVSIIGESMEGVIIKNAPPTSAEGLDKADLFKNTSEGLYLQDLTLQNGFPYTGNDGRAPTLHDMGTKTINKNVRHLSYQDTYYSNKTGGLYYFEGGEIHGTVDYLCGDGKVYFNGVKLVNEERSSATVTANSELYVFNNCVIENNADKYNFGRAWSNNPVCIWLNTTLMDPDKLVRDRWLLTGINCDYSIAGEYGTKNAEGTDITPESNNVTFTKNNTQMNTILSAEQAATYTINYVLGDWAATAKAEATQVAAPKAKLSNDGKKITWTPANDGATAYAIFKDGKFLGITTGSEWTIEEVAGAPHRAGEEPQTTGYTIRAANSRGGFGPAADVSPATSIAAIEAELGGDVKIYDLNGRRVMTPTKGVYIINGKKVVIK